MGELVELDDHRPIWVNSLDECTACGADCVSTHPVDMRRPAECPRCGDMALVEREQLPD